MPDPLWGLLTGLNKWIEKMTRLYRTMQTPFTVAVMLIFGYGLQLAVVPTTPAAPAAPVVIDAAAEPRATLVDDSAIEETVVSNRGEPTRVAASRR